MSVHTCDSQTCTTWRGNATGACTGSVVTYAGAVLGTYERNGYDDSDFYAIVWDAARAVVTSVEYATTRGWTYHNGATVDATPEVVALARAWAVERWERVLTARAEIEAVKPSKGKRVRSTTTRGKNVGVEGIVMWEGIDNYRSSRWVTVARLGVRVEGEPKLRYLAGDAVEVIDPAPVDAAQVRAQAQYLATDRNLRSALEAPLGLALSL